jgi:hypothetical protein
MKRFLKLLSFELDRLWKIYVVLLGLTFVFQFLGVILTSEKYISKINDAIQGQGMTKADVLNQYGSLNFGQILQSKWFSFSIVICVVVMGLFIFWIWYRDWLGKNTFIYRLLMLPTSRLNVYFAKLGALLLAIFGLIAFQLLLLPFEMKLFQTMIPAAFRRDYPLTGVIWAGSYFNLMIPQSFIEFVFYYFIGSMVVFVLFTAILFERSFHFKGILLGIVYAGVSIVLFLAPLLIVGIRHANFLYPLELISLEVILGVIVCFASIGTSHYLIKRKITV